MPRARQQGAQDARRTAAQAQAAAPARPVSPRPRRPCPVARTRTSGHGATTPSISIAARVAAIWDMDGNEYIDLRMGYGPVILGHGDARVDDYVNERMRRGVSFSLTSEDELEAMELLKQLTGWVGKARMTVSGTEATMHAMRVARAYTGRNKIVKFEGQYHGVHDYALVSVTPNDMAELGDRGQPGRAGVGPRHPRGRDPDDHPGSLQRDGGAAPDLRARRRRHRRDHRRARARERAGDHAAARLPRGDARAHEGVRRAPHLRRGQDRLPVRARWRRRVLRRHAGPRDVREGDGQRLSRRRVRRHG